MYAGTGASSGGDELGVLVDVDVVLVAIVVLPAFLRPAGITVFLRQFGRGLAPVDRHRIGLDEGVVLASVALDRHRDKGGVNDLAALEFDSSRRQCLIRSFEQGISQLVLFERFTKCPHGAGIGYVACQFKTEETHERQAVANLVLQALV